MNLNLWPHGQDWINNCLGAPQIPELTGWQLVCVHLINFIWQYGNMHYLSTIYTDMIRALLLGGS